jgi:hypothetical protein
VRYEFVKRETDILACRVKPRGGTREADNAESVRDKARRDSASKQTQSDHANSQLRFRHLSLQTEDLQPRLTDQSVSPNFIKRSGKMSDPPQSS